MDEDAIWAAEERLWLEGAEAYRALLHPDCLMVFGRFGVVAGAAAIAASLAGAPRWAAVTMAGRVLARPGDGLLVLAYRAEGRRDAGPDYRAWCCSTWRQDGEGWRMVQHAQAPEG